MARDGNGQSLGASLRRRIFSLPTLFSFVIAAAFIYFLATRFELDWAATWRSVRSMNPWLYLLAFLMYYISFLFRGVRWRILARNAAGPEALYQRLPSSLACAQLIIIGWFVNSIAWLRLGDAYRAYGFAEDSGGSFSWSLGTVLAERVVDMVTVFLLIIVGAVALSTTVVSDASRFIVLTALGMAGVLVVLMFLMRLYGARLAQLLPRRMETAYRRFHQGTLGSFKTQLPAIFVLGLLGWLFEMARLYFVALALGFDIGIPLVIVASLGHAILTTVPTPGGVGAVEPGVTGLLVLGLERHDAAAMTLVDRTITYLSIIVVGGILFAAWRLMRSRQRPAAYPAQAAGEGGDA